MHIGSRTVLLIGAVVAVPSVVVMLSRSHLVSMGFARNRSMTSLAPRGETPRRIDALELDADVSLYIGGPGFSTQPTLSKRKVILRPPHSFEITEDTTSPPSHHSRWTIDHGDVSAEVDGLAVLDGPSTRRSAWNKFAEYSLLYLSDGPSYCGPVSSVAGADRVGDDLVEWTQLSGPCGSLRVIYNGGDHRVVRLLFPVRVSAPPRTMESLAAAQTGEHSGYDTQASVSAGDYRRSGRLVVPYRTERIVDVRREVMTIVSVRVHPTN